MAFVFDWSTFGSANGTTSLNDGPDTLDVTVTSDSNFHVSSIDGSDALRSSNQTDDKSTIIAFDQNVEEVSFKLFDIDQGSSSSGASTTWDDQITLIARDADDNIIPLPASVISGLAHHTVTVNPDGSITIDSEGNDDPGVEGAGAVDSVAFSFAGPVASIEVVHQVGDDGADNTGVIGISNLTIGAVALPEGDNIVDGTGGDDVMLVGYVDGDDDTIDGADGDDDTIFGYGGDDTIEAGAGINTIDGGFGDDVFIGGEGADAFQGGAGQDNLDYSNSASAVTVDLSTSSLSGGDADNDTILGGIDGVIGSDFDDVLTGFDAVGTDPSDTFTNELFGGEGEDVITGLGGADLLDGGAGDDDLYGGEGDDAITGGAGSDFVEGGAGSDTLDGGRDDDTIIAGAGDLAMGGHGDDVFTIDTAANDAGATTLDIIGGETGEANQADNDDTTNDDYPGAPNEFGDVLDLTILFSSGLLSAGDVNFDDSSRESGDFNYTNDEGEDVTVTFSEIENVIVCFTRGTMIVTDAGEKVIEDLVAGDMVMTKDHGLQELRWIGSRTVPAKDSFAPIMIKSGVMGNDRDLMVSPQHRMVVEGWKSELLFGEREVLATAKYLVNNDTIYVQAGGMVEYFHMLFDRHEIVYANGAASESFHPGEVGINALTNEARDEIYTLFPELRDNVGAYGPAARTSLKGHEAKILAKNPDFLC